MKIPGFYIAHHITFDAYFGANHVFKVGHTGDLRRRLQDNAFQTCFLHKFKHALTVETKTTKEAQDLEKDVLGDLARKKTIYVITKDFTNFRLKVGTPKLRGTQSPSPFTFISG